MLQIHIYCEALYICLWMLLPASRLQIFVQDQMCQPLTLFTSDFLAFDNNHPNLTVFYFFIGVGQATIPFPCYKLSGLPQSQLLISFFFTMSEQNIPLDWIFCGKGSDGPNKRISWLANAQEYVSNWQIASCKLIWYKPVVSLSSIHAQPATYWD